LNQLNTVISACTGFEAPFREELRDGAPFGEDYAIGSRKFPHRRRNCVRAVLQSNDLATE